MAIQPDPVQFMAVAEGFRSLYERAAQLRKDAEIVLSQGETPETVEEARKIRLQMVKVRTGIDAEKDAQKSSILLAGRVLDLFPLGYKSTYKPIEDALYDLENAAKLREAERKRVLGVARQDELKSYNVERAAATLEEWDEEVYGAFLSQSKTQFEAAEAARIAAEKAEQEAKEAEVRRLKVRDDRTGQALREGVALQISLDEIADMTDEEFAEAIETAKALKVEQEKKAAAEKKRLEDEAKEREAQLAIERKAREEAEEETRKAKEEAARIKSEADAKAKAEADAAEALAKAGDAEKMKHIQSRIRGLLVDIDYMIFDSKAAKEAIGDVFAKLDDALAAAKI